MFPESEYERLTTRLKVDFEANDWLTIGGNVNLSLSDQTGVGGAGTGSIVNPFGFAKNINRSVVFVIGNDLIRKKPKHLLHHG